MNVDPRDRAPDPVLLLSTRPSVKAVTRYVLDVTRWPDLRADATLADVVGLGRAEPLVIVDVDGAPTNGRTEDVARARPEARIVALSGDASGAAVLSALRAGVRAFVRAPEELMTLDDILDRVARGETVLRLDLQRAAVQELGRVVRRVRQSASLDEQLTRRERDILVLLADGLTARQIGSRLSISPRTVERHANGLYRKLDVRTRVQAVARAAAIGLVDVR